MKFYTEIEDFLKNIDQAQIQFSSDLAFLIPNTAFTNEYNGRIYVYDIENILNISKILIDAKIEFIITRDNSKVWQKQDDRHLYYSIVGVITYKQLSDYDMCFDVSSETIEYLKLMSIT